MYAPYYQRITKSPNEKPIYLMEMDLSNYLHLHIANYIYIYGIVIRVYQIETLKQKRNGDCISTIIFMASSYVYTRENMCKQKLNDEYVMY